MRYLHEIHEVDLLAITLGLARDEIDEAIAAPAKVRDFTFTSNAEGSYLELKLSGSPCGCGDCKENFG